jgi:hypothetical protein
MRLKYTARRRRRDKKERERVREKECKMGVTDLME